jgi:molecular chaperone DnaK (HSP70)
MQDIVIVLEPEAASLCVHNQQGAEVESGDVVLVLDCGGGTVDLVTHDVQADGTVKELEAGSGDCFGGSCVDTGFTKLMERKFGAVFIDWAKSKPKDVVRLRKHWLTTKKVFGSGKAMDVSLVSLPPSLLRILENEGLLDEDDDELELSEGEMKSIFDPIVDRILELTEEQYKTSARAPTKLLLVGGFAGSPYLQQRVKAAYEGRVKAVVVPPTPGAAVVKGAVIYGLNPKVVAARVARRSYGIQSRTQFRAGRHKEMHKGYDQGKRSFYARKVFKPFVKAGSTIQCDETITHHFHVLRSDQTEHSLKIFSCTHGDPVHTDEESVRREGRLVVPAPGQGMDRSVKVMMKFGRTLIQVSAINEAGDQVETQLQFQEDGLRERVSSGLEAAESPTEP